MECEVLIGDLRSAKALRVLHALAESAPMSAKITTRYEGNSEILMLWGIGRAGHSEARNAHISLGGHAGLWDMGYFTNEENLRFRLSINQDHPQSWLDKTNLEPNRWNSLGLPLQEWHDKEGHILVIGMGRKSHSYLGTSGWESRTMQEVRRANPSVRVRLRPKPTKGVSFRPIEDDLRGASKIVCRHSNVAVLAALYGIPFECEDGAAKWLMDRPFTPENRLEFLHRLAWWQWEIKEFPQAWDFFMKITARA